MRASQMLIPTRKEDPADAEVISHKLLIRAGYIRMVSRGIYTLLPLGWRSVRKIEQIVREEMDRAGAQEILMPGVQPAELWQESGRWDEYGPELLRFKDRKGADFVLGPTHEEVVTDIVRQNVTSYKQLPINLYQIQSKFRDETRPRFGLMRGREFIMKDAYSFDVDQEAAHRSYQQMFSAYQRIFTRFGFDFRAVEADTGNIGGSLSHEFQVLAETGEDRVVSCPSCGYTANVEKAEVMFKEQEASQTAQLELSDVSTPNARTIAEVSALLKRPAQDFIKTLIYMADGRAVAILVRGDHDINEIKLKAYLNTQTPLACAELALASDEAVGAATRAPVGFIGPMGLTIPVYADLSVRGMVNAVTGANKNHTHAINVNVGRDFAPTAFADLRMADAGDQCGRCGGTFEAYRGIEVGHIFYLGTKYTKALNAMLQGEDGKSRPIEMGCYGIGITRILAAAVEQNHDDSGIVLPVSVAPFSVVVMPLQPDDEVVMAEATRIYDALRAQGVDVLLDERDLRPGGKFKDADLIGIPLQVRIGAKGIKEGKVEFKLRRAKDVELIATEDILGHLERVLAEERAVPRHAEEAV
jgi:prolyl-tRNA synthetase